MEPSDYLKAVDSYGNTMYRIARSYCRCHADAEDIVQSVFEKLLMAKVEFQDEQHLKKWLIRVTVNEAKNLCASFWKRNMVSWENTQTSQAYDFSYPEQSDLYDAVQKLPIKYRSVVHLYYYEHYSIKEIADILKLRETTVQTQTLVEKGMKRVSFCVNKDNVSISGEVVQTKNDKDGNTSYEMKSKDGEVSTRISVNNRYLEDGSISVVAGTKDKELAITLISAKLEKKGKKVYLVIGDGEKRLDITKDFADGEAKGEFNLDGEFYQFVVAGTVEKNDIEITQQKKE